MYMLTSLTLATCAIVSRAAVPSDLVPNIPGYGAPPSRTYSGYLEFDSTQHFHYVFSEAIQVAPATAPVVLWLNGGPGCSSLDGMLYENGPLHVIEPITTNPPALYRNNYTWNNIANMIWLESPCGVGFSYCDTTQGLQHDDATTAAQNLQALITFFGLYPEYAKNDFFITGESYAGIYIPTLTQAIIKYNAGSPAVPIPIKAIAVGNGCIGEAAGVCGGAIGSERFHFNEINGHGLVSPLLADAAIAACGADFSKTGGACNSALSAISSEVGRINTYGIYSPCINNDTGALPSAEDMIAQGRARIMRPLVGRAAELGLVGGPVACIDGGAVIAYFDHPEVKAAWHVAAELNWALCTNNRSFSYSRTEQDERVDVYPDIVKSGTRVLIYNGEADNCVPWSDNQWWTASFALSQGMENTTAWRAWMVDSNNVGGYITEYTPAGGASGSFAFTTIRGAGHMVPQTQPEAAFAMFSNFLSNSGW